MTPAGRAPRAAKLVEEHRRADLHSRGRTGSGLVGYEVENSCARVAELVDARDLKSLDLWLYRFDSGPGHQRRCATFYQGHGGQRRLLASKHVVSYA